MGGVPTAAVVVVAVRLLHVSLSERQWLRAQPAQVCAGKHTNKDRRGGGGRTGRHSGLTPLKVYTLHHPGNARALRSNGQLYNLYGTQTARPSRPV